jgi:TPR repeat protein
VSRALVGPVAALALVLLPGLAGAQSQVEGELNRGKAAMQLSAAAEQNHPRAEENLGTMYQLGRGVAKNCKAAVEWYARGALQNDHGNLYSLARMYHYGFGVKEERAKAHALYRQSAALGNLKVARGRGRIRRRSPRRRPATPLR